MGTFFFQKNERHAAWERSLAQPYAVNRARPDPTTQKAIQGDAKNWKKASAPYWKLKHQSAQPEKQNFKKRNGRPQTIGK